ncbi:MAG: universal stress protein [Nitrososphaeraceae archaeon]
MSYNNDFKNILVPIDGSEFSIRALKYAITITNKFDSNLIALHIVPSIKYNFFKSDENIKSNSPENLILQSAYMEAQKWFDDIKEKLGVKFITDVIIAKESIVKEIIEYSEREKIDLIIIGTRGRSGLKKLLLGSTASGIVTYANCPVIVIK